MDYEFIELPFGDFGDNCGSGESGDFGGDCGGGDCGDLMVNRVVVTVHAVCGFNTKLLPKFCR